MVKWLKLLGSEPG